MLQLLRTRVITIADRAAPHVADVEGDMNNRLEVIRELLRAECHRILEEISNTEIRYEREGLGDEWRDCLDEIEVERRTKREFRDLEPSLGSTLTE